jgi:DNA-binding transcriptional ArsR family regulator
MNALAGLPNSAISVHAALTALGSLDHSELIVQTGLAPRTVRYALTKLKGVGLLQESLNFRDMRRIIYSLKSQ